MNCHVLQIFANYKNNHHHNSLNILYLIFDGRSQKIMRAEPLFLQHFDHADKSRGVQEENPLSHHLLATFFFCSHLNRSSHGKSDHWRMSRAAVWFLQKKKDTCSPFTFSGNISMQCIPGGHYLALKPQHTSVQRINQTPELRDGANAKWYLSSMAFFWQSFSLYITSFWKCR